MLLSSMDRSVSHALCREQLNVYVRSARVISDLDMPGCLFGVAIICYGGPDSITLLAYFTSNTSLLAKYSFKLHASLCMKLIKRIHAGWGTSWILVSPLGWRLDRLASSTFCIPIINTPDLIFLASPI